MRGRVTGTAIMPTDELCRVDQTSRVRVKRIDSAIRHNQKAGRKGPWALRVATRAAWRRPTSVHDYCFSFRLSVRRTALLGEYSVEVGGARLRLVIHSS